MQGDLQVDNASEIKKEFDNHDFSKSLSNHFNKMALRVRH
jgi:hypothetical protein